MPELDSTGQPIGVDPNATPEVQAAQREAFAEPDEDEPPAGSWRSQFRNWESDTAVIVWDGEEWEIPAQMPQSYLDASREGDVRGMLRAILGFGGYAKLGIPTDYPAEELGDVIVELDRAAGKVWGVGNFNRSSRRSRGTTKR